jgi:8-oxo-dGTP pyrophosphatase MutT (NUDIX family)
MRPLFRRASRLIVTDPEHRVLLVQYVRPNGERFWATPGGGLGPEETFEQAARRELQEEVGLIARTLEPLWVGEAKYTFGGREVHQEERFFLVRLPNADLGEATDDARMQEGILELRWWALDAIEGTHETIYPDDLARELRRHLSLGGTSGSA